MICSTGRRHTGHALVVAMMSSAHDLHTTACPHDRHKGAQTPGYCILICVRTLSSSLLVLASFRVQLPAGAAAGGLDNTCRAPSQGAQLTPGLIIQGAAIAASATPTTALAPFPSPRLRFFLCRADSSLLSDTAGGGGGRGGGSMLPKGTR